MPNYPIPPEWVHTSLLAGRVIPAHPLALDANRRFDERRQRALTRYYHAAGAGGIAVGVHTTQFAIRDPRYALYQPVLRLASDTIAACDQATDRRTVCIAGVRGASAEATAEAALGRASG